VHFLGVHAGSAFFADVHFVPLAPVFMELPALTMLPHFWLMNTICAKFILKSS
jgi:hypothetical protein